MDFIYQRDISPSGIAVEEIYGAEEKSPKVWKLFASQIFSEAEGDYRTIVHMENGAPLLEGIPQRISVSHTPHHLVVASIPKTPDINLNELNVRTAIGVDIEKQDRRQVLNVVDKFLTPEEQSKLNGTGNDGSMTLPEILAWTCKEALYKAVMGAAPDWKNDYRILTLPEIATGLKEATPDKYGNALVRMPGSCDLDMHLSSWISEGHVVTLAFSSKIPMFK